MEINKLAARPTLHEITIDDTDIIETYGEPVTFWMKDHIDLQTYFDFYKFQRESEGEDLMRVLRKIILNAEARPAIGDEEFLPIDLTLAVMYKINEHLGKSKTRLSKKETGTQS